MRPDKRQEGFQRFIRPTERCGKERDGRNGNEAAKVIKEDLAFPPYLPPAAKRPVHCEMRRQVDEEE
jgi:hypothetical protein